MTTPPGAADRWVRRVARPIRLARGWSLGDLAAACGLSPERLWDLEAGTSASPVEVAAIRRALAGVGPGRQPIATTGDLADLLRLVPPDTPLAIALEVDGQSYVATLDGAGLDPRDGTWYLQVAHG